MDPRVLRPRFGLLVPIAESLQAFNTLVIQGKVRYTGEDNE
jgi:aryl-alcohol dehydrogenase-like predicted oxidoreductase